MSQTKTKGIVYTAPSEDLLNHPDTSLLYKIQQQLFNNQEHNKSIKLANTTLSNSNISTSITNTSESKSTIINVVSTIRDLETNKKIVNKYKNKDLIGNIDLSNYVSFALSLKQKDYISIPSKVESAVKYISPTRLKAIHQDLEVAKELCLIFISLLTSTYFEMLEGSDGWKPLHSSHLRDLFNGVADYKKIREALEHPLRENVIIKCDHYAIIDEKCFFYRLGVAYVKKGIVSYQLQTEIAKKTFAEYQLLQLALSDQNAICKNLFEFYKHIELPTIEKVNQEAKRLVDNKYKSKKGKLLRFRHKHSNDYFKEPEKLAFVEDHIKLYEYLTDKGLLRPQATKENNGGRVVDSFTLMPSWIRKMLKFKGKQLVEVDYSCLHPNAAMSLFGGKIEFLTHAQVGEETGLGISEVKLEHLSFFNKEIWQMKESPLWDYYATKESEMLKAIVDEKQSNKIKHRITSMRLLSKEVEIMTAVITKLNQEGIYVGYVYDALLSAPEDAVRVKEVMESVILEHGVKTTAKLESYKPTIEVETLHKNEPMIISADLISTNCIIRDDVRKLINRGRVLNIVDAAIVFDEGKKYRKNVVKVYDRYAGIDKYMLEEFINEDGWDVHKSVYT